MALKPPVEVPQGAIRLNTDSQKLEFFAQDQWWEMATNVPTLNGGARGMYGGGAPAAKNEIHYFTMATQGDAADFGDLTEGRAGAAAMSSRTRCCWGGGYPSSTDNETIDYVTVSSTGNALDFGDMSTDLASAAGFSSQTRGMMAGGNTGGGSGTYYNNIQYITIATTGNALDFGDLTGFAPQQGAGFANPTRGFVAGGYQGSPVSAYRNVIEWVLIATTGNGTDFGDLTTYNGSNGGCSNPVRGLVMGGQSPTLLNTIDYITMASKGGGVQFGDLSALTCNCSCCGDSIRGVNIGGETPSSAPSAVNTMEYVNIASTGNAMDFGDMPMLIQQGGTITNGHGGL